ncbi:MAG TPA: DUF4382 domain-containing protein [Chitinophagaceae bacterium]|jgi:hypothetical protein|nr:DUF4382 domain-containing protein [Chitinophagaceae bacterium]
MKTYALFPAVLLTFISSFFLISCSKEEKSSSGKAKLQVYLTDAPATDYEKVVIDVKDVQINVNDSSWQSLTTVKAGTYDLLKLVNDDDTLLASSDIPTGTIHQMRLVLGSNNYVVINGQNIPLETPSAQQSGLKFNVQQSVTSGILYTITLDFDAGKSIVKTGNSKYILKPVIRTVFNAVGGSIKGFVLPDTVTTAVYAIQGPDTIASTFTASNGGYLIKGLAAGSYTLNFAPNDTTFTKQTKTGIAVTTGNVTTVDTVFLHH